MCNPIPVTVHTPTGPQTWSLDDTGNGGFSAYGSSGESFWFDALDGECVERPEFRAVITADITAEIEGDLR